MVVSALLSTKLFASRFSSPKPGTSSSAEFESIGAEESEDWGWKIVGEEKIVHAADPPSLPGKTLNLLAPPGPWGSVSRVCIWPSSSGSRGNFRATAAANLAQIWPPPFLASRPRIMFIVQSKSLKETR